MTTVSIAEQIAAADRAAITAFQDMTPKQAARLLSCGVRHLLFTAGTAGQCLPAPLAALVKGEERNMFFNKAKRELIVLLVLGLIGSGANLVVHGVKAEQPPAKPAPEPPLPPIPEQQGEQLTPIPPAKEVEVKPRPARTPKERAALLKARVVAAKKAYEGERGGLIQTRRFGNMLGSISQPETIYMWSVRWLEAERSLNPKREDQIAALEAHFKRMNELQRDVKQISKDLMPRYKEDEVEWYRLEAELWLGEAKAAK